MKRRKAVLSMKYLTQRMSLMEVIKQIRGSTEYLRFSGKSSGVYFKDPSFAFTLRFCILSMRFFIIFLSPPSGILEDSVFQMPSISLTDNLVKPNYCKYPL
jgi:hypothetical protein